MPYPEPHEPTPTTWQELAFLVVALVVMVGGAALTVAIFGLLDGAR